MNNCARRQPFDFSSSDQYKTRRSLSVVTQNILFTIMTNDTKVLQSMILKFGEETKEYVVKINMRKTIVMRNNDREITKVKTKEGKNRYRAR